MLGIQWVAQRPFPQLCGRREIWLCEGDCKCSVAGRIGHKPFLHSGKTVAKSLEISACHLQIKQILSRAVDMIIQVVVQSSCLLK